MDFLLKYASSICDGISSRTSCFVWENVNNVNAVKIKSYKLYCTVLIGSCRLRLPDANNSLKSL